MESAYGTKLTSKRRIARGLIGAGTGVNQVGSSGVQSYVGVDFALGMEKYNTHGKTQTEPWWGWETQEIDREQAQPRFDKLTVQYRPAARGKLWGDRTVGGRDGPRFGPSHEVDRLVAEADPHLGSREQDTYGDQGAKLRRLAGMGTTTFTSSHPGSPAATLASLPNTANHFQLGQRLEYARGTQLKQGQHVHSSVVLGFDRAHCREMQGFGLGGAGGFGYDAACT